MKVTFSITDGPLAGQVFSFDGRDSFLVGRSNDAHLQLPHDDPYFSRRHFVVELQPPRCRLLDLKSRNGVFVNDHKVTEAELRDGDRIKAGTTVFMVSIEVPDLDSVRTEFYPAPIARVPQKGLFAFAAAESVGAKVGGYRIVRELGRGAMGVVFLGERLTDKCHVAIKQIHHTATTRAVDQFLREVAILGKLNHRNIVQFLESITVDDRPHLVMEFIDGTDAETLVRKRGMLPVGTAVRIVLQAAAGLRHAHAAGFVHRDVKPSNILIGGPQSARFAKLADFGLARAYESSKMSGLTLYNEIGGTPAFMPPEQITHYRNVKPAADQYALGATLYFLLTGRYAHNFPDGSPVAKRLVSIMTDPIIPIRDRRGDLTTELAEVIERSLEKEADRRYPSLTAFRDALMPFRKYSNR